jgi:hypothetical protein
MPTSLPEAPPRESANLAAPEKHGFWHSSLSAAALLLLSHFDAGIESMKRLAKVALATAMGLGFLTPPASARTAQWRLAGTVKYGFKLAPMYFNKQSIEFANNSTYTGTFQVRPKRGEVLRVNVGIAADCEAGVWDVDQVFEYLRDGRTVRTSDGGATQRVDFRSVDPLDWIC